MNQIKRFESLDEFLTLAKPVAFHPRDQSEWFNCETTAASVKRARLGDESIVAEAEKLIDYLDDLSEGLQLETWSPAQAGAYPIVAEYLAGSPTCMRHKQPSGDYSPVSVYVCTTSSAIVSKKQFLNRGTAILALILKLQKVRPVQLYITCELDSGDRTQDAIQIIPVDSQPLSIAQAAYLLCSTGFSRHLTYGYAKTFQDSKLKWVNHFKVDKNVYRQNIASYLELGPNDLHIEPIFVQDLLLDKPLEWVNEQLKRYNLLADES